METVTAFIFLGSKITGNGDCSHEIKRHLLLGRKAVTNLNSILQSRDITLPTKVCLVKAIFFHVMYGCESWTIKKAGFWRIDAFELWCWKKTLESPLDCKEIQPVHPKGNQSWIFIGRTDAETEAPILWPPDEKDWFIGKEPDAGKDWRQEEKGTTKDELVGWHHWLDGLEFEQALGVGDRQDREAWCVAVHGVSKSRTRLSDWSELTWSLWTTMWMTLVEDSSAPFEPWDNCSPRLDCNLMQDWFQSFLLALLLHSWPSESVR